jgi:cell wall-associated NlpC family hydrolase
MSKLAVAAVSGGLIVTLALPAYALDPAEAPPSTIAAATKPVQRLIGPADVAPQSVERATYTATPAPEPEPVPVAASAPSSSSGSGWSGTSFAPPAQTYSGAALVQYAMQFVGVVPYGTGNHPSDSFSCDGLVQYVFGAFGIALPRTANAQAAMGVQISAAQAQPGDLVWYPGQHDGIYAGGGMMIDSPKPGMMVQYRAVWGSPIYVRMVG